MLDQFARRPPLATLGNETRCRVEDSVVVVGRVEDTIQRRLGKCPLLFSEPRCVQAASLIKAHDEVHASDHLDRPAVGKLNEDLGHPHALASQHRHGVVLGIAQQPLEDGVPQPAMTAASPPSLEQLSGLVERVTFHNADSGFCVLRLKVRGAHGRQFRAVFVKIAPPNTLSGIERHLGSGMVKGIGEKRARKITAGWADQKVIREIMVFLYAHGVSTARAVRIFKTYGHEAIDVVRENPYRLARDIRGIGFLSADTIAQKVGIALDSPMRAQAGVSYALAEASAKGHCGLPHAELVLLAVELLKIPSEVIERAIDQEIADEILVADTVDQQPCVFLAPLYHRTPTRPSLGWSASWGSTWLQVRRTPLLWP